MVKYIGFILVSLLSAAAFAREVQTVHLQGGGAQGSGVLCGGTPDHSLRVILSVAHVTGTQPGRSMVATVAGRQYRATVISADARADSALLVISGRHLQNVKPARLWMGEIRQDQETRTEGWHGQQFVEQVGRPQGLINGAQLRWSSPSFPGMSGGPTWISQTVAGGPAFLTTTTASDFRSMSLGPYRTWFYRWVPTIHTQRYRFTCNSSGLIEMRPRGSIEGPITIPEAPPASTQAAKPEPTPAEPSTDELRAAILQEIDRLKSPRPKVSVVPQIQPVEDPGQGVEEGEIVVINVPIQLRIHRDERYRIEVIK